MMLAGQEKVACYMSNLQCFMPYIAEHIFNSMYLFQVTNVTNLISTTYVSNILEFNNNNKEKEALESWLIRS